MFDNIKPIDQKWERRKKQLWILLAVLVVITPILYYELKNWPEEQVAKSFMQAVVESRIDDAYKIWQPAASYTKDDFLKDWGPKSEFGKISSFRMTRSHERGTGVIITMEINGAKEVRIWVEKKTKSLGFPPY